jgi:hypothetical protein
MFAEGSQFPFKLSALISFFPFLPFVPSLHPSFPSHAWWHARRRFLPGVAGCLPPRGSRLLQPHQNRRFLLPFLPFPFLYITPSVTPVLPSHIFLPCFLTSFLSLQHSFLSSPILSFLSSLLTYFLSLHHSFLYPPPPFPPSFLFPRRLLHASFLPF